jgi:N-terminal domain of (some) glycogen debranching enzymes
MSTQVSISDDELVQIASPHVEPRIACRSQAPRDLSNNLTLIDGETSLSTTLAGDIVPSIALDVGFFHDDTRFLSHWELCVGGHQTLVLSSNTEAGFLSQIGLTTGNITRSGCWHAIKARNTTTGATRNQERSCMSIAEAK